MATLQAAPTQPKPPWCLKKQGPANRGEMEPPTPTIPSTKLQQLRQKEKKNRQHTHQRNAADSESNTKKPWCKPRAIQYLTQLQCQRSCG